MRDKEVYGDFRLYYNICVRYYELKRLAKSILFIFTIHDQMYRMFQVRYTILYHKKVKLRKMLFIPIEILIRGFQTTNDKKFREF